MQNGGTEEREEAARLPQLDHSVRNRESVTACTNECAEKGQPGLDCAQIVASTIAVQRDSVASADRFIRQAP